MVVVPMLELDALKIAVIGLGYVGLPLAAEFGKSRSVVGFDTNSQRIAQLKQGKDETREVSAQELQQASQLVFSDDPASLRECNTYIVTVPTPIDEHNRPDLSLLLAASDTIGHVLKQGDIVIYESTVYPGATQEDCVPVLEAVSGLRFNVDFHVGYSPELLNVTEN